MMKVRWLKLATAASALTLAIPLSAATGPADTSKKMTTTAISRAAWKPETLSGKITSVDADQNLVVVETTDGVPFDMVVTPKTRITSGDQGIALKDLARDTNATVWVTFTPERRGDVASSIRLGG